MNAIINLIITDFRLLFDVVVLIDCLLINIINANLSHIYDVIITQPTAPLFSVMIISNCSLILDVNINILIYNKSIHPLTHTHIF